MSRAAFYGSRATKRRRRTRSEIDVVRDAIQEILEADHPMTVRQVFYQLVTKGVIPKLESEYKCTVVRLLGQMRRDGVIPFGYISDNTRWMRKPTSYTGLEQCLQATAQFYRRDMWDDQPEYVEIWSEKDALAGVLYEETKVWDVPLMVTRGYPSITYLYEAADAIASQGKPAFLYYLGDHDPSGIDIPRAVSAGLREFAPEADIRFKRIAVTEKQIAEFSLPTRPTKKTDSRSKSFNGESVEVDAIPAAELRRIVRKSIERHVDKNMLNRTKRIENEERATLQSLIMLGGSSD